MRINHIFVLTIVLLSFCLTDSVLALKPERVYKAKPSHYGIIYQEFVFDTRDGFKIKGWFYPVQDTLGIANDLIGRYFPVPSEMKRSPRPYSTIDTVKHPTIVVCMGDAGNMADLIFYAYHLCTRGFNVLTFDWRGFGESSDWPIDQDQLSYAEFLTDYDAAIEWVKNRPEVDSAKIGVFGCSTGAYLSFAMAAKRRDIAAFAGRALMTSFKDLLSVIGPLDPKRHFKAPPEYPSNLEPTNAAENIAIPAFLIVGEKDGRTPVWMSKEVFGKIKSPKELWIVPDAEHGGMKGPESSNYPEFFVRVADFFKKYLMT